MKLLLKFSIYLSVVKNHEFKVDENELNQNIHFLGNPVIRGIRRYENDSSITWIERIVKRRNFSFGFTALLYWTTTKNFKPQEDFSRYWYSSKNPKRKLDIFTQFILENYNEVITTSTFPNLLNHANVTSV